MNTDVVFTVAIDQDEARDTLLAHLMRAGTWGHYWTPDGDPYTKDGRTVTPRYTQWFNADRPAQPIASWLDKNLYWGVHPCTQRGIDPEVKPNKQRSSVAIIQAVNCIFSEFDGKDYVRPDEYAPFLPANFAELPPDERADAADKAQRKAFAGAPAEYKRRAWQHIQQMPVRPSVIVDSGGGYQPYHLLADPVLVNDENRQHVADVQAAWVKLVGGDPQAKDLARVLRVPGTYNRKPLYGPDFPLVSIVEADFERLYTLAVFEGLTEPLRAERVAQVSSIGSLNGHHGSDYDEAADALRRLAAWRCDDRAEWIAIGHALKAGLGEAGLELWDQWSRGSRKYQPGDCEARWKNLRPNSITLATLIWRAHEDNPRPKRMQSSEVEQYEYGFVVETPDPADLGEFSPQELTGPDRPQHKTWPYAVERGRMVFLKEGKDGELVVAPIASFTAQITGQIEDEDGAKTFIITGNAIRGGAFRLEQPAEKFGKDGELRAALENAVGPYDPVYNRMSEHLVPAIKLLTTEAGMGTIRRFRRTGWKGNNFLIPGMLADDVRVELPEKLPYHIDPAADPAIGRAALVNLLESVNPSISTPVLAMLLQAPIHRAAGWQNERYGLFIQGRTGSLKTSFTQAIMSIYGVGFSNDRTLIKLGEGSTRNAIMSYAANAHDMPLFIDNYKPNTGFGFNDLVNLIHNILEGGEKDRLTRASVIKESRPIHCFPVITGEDIPDHDPATLARLLLVGFEWQAGQPNDKLAAAQMDSAHLSAIGATWLTWVQSEDGQRIIKDVAKSLPATRNNWAQFLRITCKDMVNALRVATNLATNELTWTIALQHPVLGELLAPYTQAFGDGLRTIATSMARSTTESLEVYRFLAGLRELLASKQGMLLDAKIPDIVAQDKDRMLGWEDDDGAYLLPTIAVERVRKLLGAQSFTCSLQVLYSQLEALRMLAKTGGDKVTYAKRFGGQVHRILHLKPEILRLTEAPEDLAGELGL